MGINNATMHCQSELLEDIKYKGYIPDETMLKWYHDRYSTSKHLLTLYSLVKGINAKTILEIGFGRSSFVLVRAAHENGGKFLSCDMRSFEYLFNGNEKNVTTFYVNRSDYVWQNLKNGIDFAFLDYFSDQGISTQFIYREIKRCLNNLKQNGIVAIHDTETNTYNVKRAIRKLNNFFNRNKYEITTLPYNYGLSIIVKRQKSKFGIVTDKYSVKKLDTKLKV